MSVRIPMVRLAILLALTLALAPAAISRAENTPSNPSEWANLARAFQQPPDAARPWVYWFIMEGNMSREGITADLEAMARVGIGGVIPMEINAGVPRGPVKFMSAEWRGLFKHAVEEAERLGLQITLNAGPGWTGSGGPWVKPEQSMQHLVASRKDFSGPARFDTVLPRPKPRAPYFGGKGLPPDLLERMQGFYADVAVLALPKFKGEKAIADIDEKALYLRHPYSCMAGVKPWIPAPASFPAAPEGATIDPQRIIDLTDRLQPDGRLVWDAPAGDWTILRFGRVSTGVNTRPAPQAGLGLESDKFDPAALDAHFEDFVGALMRTVGPRPLKRVAGWTMLHIDSWEMGAQNWTANFRKEFKRRRGYDPLKWLPVMLGRIVESRECSERFLWDLRQTAQELVIENHARRLRELAHENGFGLSIEPYDMNPTADLALGAEADVPMGEFWAVGDAVDTIYSCIEAISIGHTLGKPIVGAESFTAMGHLRWTRHPGSMKNQADWALALGINRIVFHRYAHQPWLDRAPGMTMGAIGSFGTEYERTVTWWEFSKPWHEYLSRCQYLLRRGLPVADILYLTPEGAPQVFRAPADALGGTAKLPDRKGYAFDAISPDALLKRVKVRDGQLTLPDGMSYGVLVLPDVETMTPELLQKVKSLLKSGATVIGPPPLKSPSLVGYPKCDEAVRKLAAELWGPEGDKTGAAERRIGKGRLIATARSAAEKENPFSPPYVDYDTVARVLGGMRTPPDFQSDIPLRYIHRRDGEADFYYVSNPQDKEVAVSCRFRVAEKQASLWNPETGRITQVGPVANEGGLTRLALTLDPHGSVFVCFSPETLAFATAGPRVEKGKVLVTLDGPWEVSFPPKLGAPERVRLNTLIDWTKHSDPGVQHFSGTATYRKTFALPSSALTGARRPLYLDLGEVHELARVKLNGQPLGVLWKPPFRLDLSKALRSGENSLEVEVVNLWRNRLAGDQSLPPAKRIGWTLGGRFRTVPSLLPSGLLGPVTLRTAD